MKASRKGIPGYTIRLAIFLLWAVLFALLLQREYFVRPLDLREVEVLQRDRQEDFLGIYFRDERIGFVRNRYLPAADGSMRLEQTALIHLNIVERTYPVRMELAASLTPSLELNDLDFSLTSPLYRMNARGQVEGTSIRYQLETGGFTTEDLVRLSERPLLPTSRRGYLLRPDLVPGDRLKVPYFDPLTLSAKESLLEYRGEVKELVKGRVHTLHKFHESVSGIRISLWLDEQGRVIKEESPAGFVLIAEPEFRATSIVTRGEEILSSVAVPLKEDMPPLAGRNQIRYRISLPGDGIEPPSGDRQHFEDGVLTVTMERLPPEAEARACSGRDRDLAATPYIQAGHPEISARAESVAGSGISALEKARLLAEWVHDYLEKRPVIGIPDALGTLRSGRGDCNEHAALFAALARSQGIPARVAAGVVHQAGAFYYHAWNEICLDDAWIGVDTSMNQFPPGLTHIKFVEGETEEMVRIGSLLGRLEIKLLAEEVRSEK